MEYRLAEIKDWPYIVEFLGSTSYFFPVEPYKLGGHWLLAMSEGRIVGTLWFFAEPPQAFLGYWTARYPRVAARLALVLERHLIDNGVQYVHGMVADGNENARRFMVKGLGCQSAYPYYEIFKEIGNGADADAANHDPR